jgi:polysaccharide export outer membrane protein
MARASSAFRLVFLPLFAAGSLSATTQRTPATSSTIEQPASAPKSDGRPISEDSGRIDSKAYIIGENDLLDVNVWKEKEVSRTISVRPDGKITLPLVGEIQASGMTPLQLQDNIGQRLKAYLSNPEVTVMVSDPRSHHFNIVGQVLKPGTYTLSQSTTVLDAISSAGGFRDFAKETKIYVLRTSPGGGQVRLPFNYKEIIKGKNPASNIALNSGDTIVVP